MGPVGVYYGHPGSFSVYSGTGDIGRLLTAYGCTASPGRIVFPGQNGCDLVLMGAPSRIRTCAHGSGEFADLTL